MPQIETTKKYLNHFTEIKKEMNGSVHSNISQVFRARRIPSNYVGILIKHGLMDRVDGGKRGRGSYRWNHSVELNEQVVKRCINNYNRIRHEDYRRRCASRQTLEQRIEKLEEDVKRLTAAVSGCQ